MLCARSWSRSIQLAIIVLASATAQLAVAATFTVNVQNFSFAPANITVAPGDTIHWVWVSGLHTVTSGSGCTANGLYFDHAIDSTAGNTTFDFVVPAGVPSIPYFCRNHCVLNNMKGVITVQSTSIANLMITIDGFQETPPTGSTATGSGTATLDTVTGLFSWNISFSGLGSSQSAAHFHGAADACNEKHESSHSILAQV